MTRIALLVTKALALGVVGYFGLVAALLLLQGLAVFVTMFGDERLNHAHLLGRMVAYTLFLLLAIWLFRRVLRWGRRPVEIAGSHEPPRPR